MRFSEFQQTNDYNCAPYATAFLLMLHGLEISPRVLEELMEPNPSFGTPAHKVAKSLLKLRIDTYLSVKGSISDRQLPALVLITFEGDAHYVVVTAYEDGVVSLFDPWYGRIVRWREEDFEEFWIGKSAAIWSLSIRNTKDAVPAYPSIGGFSSPHSITDR